MDVFFFMRRVGCSLPPVFLARSIYPRFYCLLHVAFCCGFVFDSLLWHVGVDSVHPHSEELAAPVRAKAKRQGVLHLTC